MTVQVQRRRKGWRLSAGIGNDVAAALRDVADLEAIVAAPAIHADILAEAEENRRHKEQMKARALKAGRVRKENANRTQAGLLALVAEYRKKNPGHSLNAAARHIWKKTANSMEFASTLEAFQRKIHRLHRKNDTTD